jgi:hypothetical protein
MRDERASRSALAGAHYGRSGAAPRPPPPTGYCFVCDCERVCVRDDSGRVIGGAASAVRQDRRRGPRRTRAFLPARVFAANASEARKAGLTGKSAASRRGAGEVVVVLRRRADSLARCSGIGGERQSDHDCPIGDRGALTPKPSVRRFR